MLVALFSELPAATMSPSGWTRTAVLTRTSPGQAATPLQTVSTPGPPLTIDGKPAIVFASEEPCPLCAAERRPLVVALSNSGSWSHLGSTKPSVTDVYPDTATLSSRAARNLLCEPPSSPATSGAP